MAVKLEPSDLWPLPGQVDPAVSPCAFCRRRLIVDGEQVFATCCCREFGPRVTVGSLVVGALLVVGLGALLVRR